MPRPPVTVICWPLRPAPPCAPLKPRPWPPFRRRPPPNPFSPALRLPLLSRTLPKLRNPGTRSSLLPRHPSPPCPFLSCLLLSCPILLSPSVLSRILPRRLPRVPHGNRRQNNPSRSVTTRTCPCANPHQQPPVPHMAQLSLSRLRKPPGNPSPLSVALLKPKASSSSNPICPFTPTSSSSPASL